MFRPRPRPTRYTLTRAEWLEARARVFDSVEGCDCNLCTPKWVRCEARLAYRDALMAELGPAPLATPHRSDVDG